MPDNSQILCLAGMALFGVGLANGFAIPILRSPRLALSAHLTAVQSGTFLIAAGLMWPHLDFGAVWSGIVAHTLWISLVVLWISLLLAAAFGAGRDLPIAGGGIKTTRSRQILVSVLLIGGSLGSILAVAALLATWQWQA